MEREISVGAWLGIGLLVLAALVAIAFLIFSIMKNIANDGTTQTQDQLGNVSNQVFLDYDQKIITGQQLISGLKTFEGKPYAVLISTKKTQEYSLGGSTTITSTDFHSGTNFVTLETTIGNSKKDVKFVNYNGQLQDIDKTSKNGVYTTQKGLQTDNGEIVYDNDTAQVYKDGNPEYISAATKFKANLIKNTSGDILGVAGLQK